MSTLEESLYGIGNIVVAVGGAYQASSLHQAGQKFEDELHQKEMKLMKEQHRKELLAAKQTYLLSTFTELEQYCQELNENLLSSSRDAERDMVDQRNQQFQTILLAGTIMLTALICVLIQGVLKPGSSVFMIVSYSLSNSISLVCLSICILLCIEITFRVSKFMYNKSIANIEHLSDAMLHTSEVMKNLRGDTWLAQGRRKVDATQSVNDADGMDTPQLRPTPGSFTRQFTKAAHDLRRQSSASPGRLSPTRSKSRTMDFNSWREEEEEVKDVGEGVPHQQTPEPTRAAAAEKSKSERRMFRRPVLFRKSRSALSLGSVPTRTTGTGSSGFGGLHKSNSQYNLMSSVTATNRTDYYANLMKRQRITTFDPQALDLEWGVHEQQIQEYFATRDKINERMELLAVANNILDSDNANAKRVSFELFWKENCHTLSNVALVLFYLGTSAMLVATMVFMYEQFTLVYLDRTAGLIGISTIGMSLVLCLALALYLRYLDPSLALMKDQIDKETVVEKKGIMSRLTAMLGSVLRGRSRSSQISADTMEGSTVTPPAPAPAATHTHSGGGRGLTLDVNGDEEAGPDSGVSSYAAFNHFNHELRLQELGANQNKKSK